MGQNRNNNYRCDDEHLNKIAQLANLHNVSKTQICIRAVDKYYEVQDIYIDALEAEHELLKGAYAELEAENANLREAMGYLTQFPRGQWDWILDYLPDDDCPEYDALRACLDTLGAGGE